ncbi:MAG: nodulation protein NfeD, partial [Bdellovibrionales bacterium]|nr:nodulation protein NfeD [Bdellovibrionales bacterium]
MIRLLLALFLASAAHAAAAEGPVLLIDVQGTINPGSADFIRTSIEEAGRRHAQALVIRLNTPGGLLTSTREIVQHFSESAVPVVIWVAPGGASATSAGAIISVAAHLSAMAPGTNIGAAHPVGPGGQE